MGTEQGLDGNQSKEILQTEYANTPYDKEFYIDINNKYDIKIMNKNSKNKKNIFGKKNKLINNPKNIENISNTYSRNSENNIFNKKKSNQNKNKKKEKEIIYRNNHNHIPHINKVDNTIYFDYFKCISCPMCILIEINHKNNHVKIKCENGHNNEMNIDSFISIYQSFKYSCDKCKNELTSKYYYCSKCKELLCDSCMKKTINDEINKEHIFLNEISVNFICDIHKKRFVNFCKNCQKNCCKKCSAEHSSHELLLIKNEIRDNNYILQIEKMLEKEKEIIDNIEIKYPRTIFKNQNQNLLKNFNRLISLRKKEYQLKNKILKIYKDSISQIDKNINENNLDLSISSISSSNGIGDNPNNFLMNFYFLKNINELENEVLSCEDDFFDFSEDNKYYNDFSELKNYLLNYKKNLIPPEKNLENFSKIYTIHKKPNFIFPLNDGNFIVTYDTKIIFYDGLNGSELLILDEEIFDYTYKIIKLPDETILFFGDFLNQIKIDENGRMKVLFTGSHIEILKEVILDENNLVFIDKLTQKLKILTNKDINWHKEIFSENSESNDEKIDLNKSMAIDIKNIEIKKGEDNINENKLNNSFMTMNESKDAKELFLNSIKSIRENKKKKINEIITNNKNYQIKTFDIISLDENNFISLQEKKFLDKETCLRIFNFDKNNQKFNLKDIIYLEDAPLKKSDVLYLIKNDKESDIKYSYLCYGTNNKKYFIVFDLDKKITVSKINFNFFYYKFFGNILLYHFQNELFQYVFNGDEFIFISKLTFNDNIYSINFLKDFSLVLDDKKYTYLYSYKKVNENI